MTGTIWYSSVMTKTIKLQIRLTESEYTEFKRLAVQRAISLTELIVNSVLGVVMTKGDSPARSVMTTIPKPVVPVMTKRENAGVVSQKPVMTDRIKRTSKDQCKGCGLPLLADSPDGLCDKCRAQRKQAAQTQKERAWSEAG